jgi:tetratricopeptide (TPR) repeat protein
VPSPVTKRGPLVLITVLLALACVAARRDNWVEVRSPNFIVVSNAGEKQARKTALQFEEIREVFRASLKVAAGHPTPVVTVIAAKDEDTMKQLLPEDYVKGHVHHTGLFVYRMNIYFAAVLLGQEGTSPYETFYHEYYHLLTVPYFPDLPLWVAEGLAEFFGHTQIDDKSVSMGRADANLLEELRDQPFIPLNVLFRVDASSPYYNEDKKTSIFYAESWALTHYLMVGDRAAHRPMFNAYLKALGEGKSQEEAAAATLGDLKKLQSDLLSYIHNARFYDLTAPAVPKVSDGDLHVRPISEAEAEAYRGGFAAIRGRLDDAKQLLEQAVQADPKIALAHEYLGLAQFVDGNHPAALQSLSDAINLDPNNSFTRFLRAELDMMGGGTMSHNPRVEDDLRQAVALSPNFSAPYGLLAAYLAAQNKDLPEALTFAQQALSFEPANSSYQLDLAEVLARLNRFDDARMAALRAQAWARRPEEKGNATAFLTYLQQAADYYRSSASAPSVTGVADDSDTPQESDIEQGVVSNGRCERGLMFDLKTDDGLLHLHASPRGDFRITIEGAPIQNFSPCTSLNGLEVEVRYQPDEGHTDSGTVRSLRIFAPERRPDSTPGTSVADGTVSGVLCNGNEMQLTLAMGGKSLVFHAKDFTKVTYLAGANSSLGDLDPCSELKARAVKITYATALSKPFAGEMRTIVVGK